MHDRSTVGLRTGVARCGWVLAACAGTATAQDARVIVDGGMNSLEVNGTLVHQSTQGMHGISLVEMGGEARAITWRERGPGNADQSYYAYSRNGADWSRALEGDNTHLDLRWGRFDPLAGDLPSIPAPFRARPDHRAFIVQYAVPPFDVAQHHAQNVGAVIRASLPASSLIVEIDPASAPALRALPGVRWVGPFEPAFKTDPAILRAFLPNLAERDAAARAEFAARWNPDVVQSMERLSAGESASFWIQTFEPSMDAKTRVADAIKAAGGVIQNLPEGDNLLRAMLNADQLLAVLHRSEVSFVDPWGPGGTDMDIVRNLSGANALEAATGFSGEGVRGEVMDSGVRPTHQAFSVPGPAPIIRVNGTATDHGSSTFGIVFGDGAVNAAGRGLLPDAEAKFFYAYTNLAGFGGSASRSVVTQEAVAQNSIVFQSNSWGSSLTTAYNTTSNAMDQMIFTTGLLICQSQSNTGTQSSRPEAWAKNVLSVGAFNHFNNLSRTDDAVGGGSIGPAQDLRIKPDLSHHYDQVLTTSSASDTSYTTNFGGTSAATPITSGHMGLIHQAWHQGVFPGHGGGPTVFASRPSPATAKALAIHSAFRYNWTGAGSNPSINRNVQGWGVVDVNRLYNLAPSLYVENQSKSLLAGQSASYTFDVPPGAPSFLATMVYLDPPGTVSSTQHRINDVSIKVTAPNGQTYWWGNNGLTTSNWSAAGGASNTRDTVENIFIQNPSPGRYRLQVFADTVTQDGNTQTPGVTDVSYSLIVSGGTRTPVRVLTLDAARSGTCGGNDMTLPSGPVFAQVRAWLSDPRLFGGAGKVDRPVSLLAPANSLTPQSLSNADVVVLTGLASPLTRCEEAVLRQFIDQGGGFLALYDQAADDFAPILQSSGTDAGSGTTFDPSPGAPVVTGPYAPVTAPLTGGSHRIVTDLGPHGTAILTSDSAPVAALFTIGAGRAMVVNDEEWASAAPVGGCIEPGLPNAANESFFLNAFASVLPTLPLSITVACCDSVDFNRDGLFPDALDLADFLSVFAGGVCTGQQPADPACNADIDFDNDGLFPNSADIDSLISVFAGAQCE